MARIRIVVVLPAPLGPMKPNRSPAARSSSIDWIGEQLAVFLRQVVGFDHGVVSCQWSVVRCCLSLVIRHLLAGLW